MLKIENLHVSINETKILQGLSLNIKAGEVHAIMGPNGSGKSTLANVLAGKDGYSIDQGSVHLEDADLLDMAPEERAAAGMFLAFQYPIEIPGVITQNFLKSSVNAVRKARGEEELDALGFLKAMKKEAAKFGVSDEKLKRALNVGFSGGEKKRMEVLQMAMLKPKIAILDETDSGLDVDALKVVADGVNAQRDPEHAFLIITHYRRLLDMIKPDVVHVMKEGKIIKTGDITLADQIDDVGFNPQKEAI